MSASHDSRIDLKDMAEAEEEYSSSSSSSSWAAVSDVAAEPPKALPDAPVPPLLPPEETNPEATPTPVKWITLMSEVRCNHNEIPVTYHLVLLVHFRWRCFHR